MLFPWHALALGWSTTQGCILEAPAWLCQALGKDCPETYTTKALRKGKAADQTALVKAKLAEAIATVSMQGVPKSTLQGLPLEGKGYLGFP